jgi:two-component system chemotaxis response regulator CheB
MEPSPARPGHDILAIGASAGGVQALCDVIEHLPPNLPAAIFVVLHITPHGHSLLPAILQRSGCMPASHPEEGEAILPGRIYVAPPDRHLAIRKGRIHLSRNASENGHRPAIDVLFRTAARSFGARVLGVVLTGNLDDGTAGLAAIKECGGLAVVQDPADADYPGMPESAIANVEVDYILPLADIGTELDRLVREPRSVAGADCAEVEEEPDDMGTSKEDQAGSATPGIPSALTCPECGGALFEKPTEPLLHFRCRTGHAYSPESLLAELSDSVESALWAALRSLEENVALSLRLEKRSLEFGNKLAGERYHRRSADAEKHAKVLRTILTQGGAELD